MKNIIDFILESKGQRPRYRATNKPYNTKNDELVRNENIREYKKYLQRLTNFFNEFNANLDKKYKIWVNAFVYVGDADWDVPKCSTDAFVEDKDTPIYKSLVQFSGSADTKLSNSTIENYDALQNPDWMTLCSFKNLVETPRWHQFGYKLEIKNDNAHYKNDAGSIYITKEGLKFYPYHSTYTADLQLLFTLDNNNIEGRNNDWQPYNMIKAICKRVYKKNGEGKIVINLKELGKGNLTGKNFAEAFNHVINNW